MPVDRSDLQVIKYLKRDRGDLITRVLKLPVFVKFVKLLGEHVRGQDRACF